MISARSAKDEIIEGIGTHDPDRRFADGVQWYAEAFWSGRHGLQFLFADLAEAAQR